MIICRSLDEVRENIDVIDAEIVKLIAKRSLFVKQAAKFKNSENDVKAPKRVEAVIEKVRKMAGDNGINADIIANIYHEMIRNFINLEMEEHIK